MWSTLAKSDHVEIKGMASKYRVYFWIVDVEGQPKMNHKDFEDRASAEEFCEQKKQINRREFGREDTVWLQTSVDRRRDR